MRARMQPGFPEAVLAAISQSTNELTQGWMRLLASAPAAADTSWLGANSALQSSYFEKQAKLWSALMAGGAEPGVSPPPRDPRVSHRQRNGKPYHYLPQQAEPPAAR